MGNAPSNTNSIVDANTQGVRALWLYSCAGVNNFADYSIWTWNYDKDAPTFVELKDPRGGWSNPIEASPCAKRSPAASHENHLGAIEVRSMAEYEHYFQIKKNTELGELVTRVSPDHC